MTDLSIRTASLADVSTMLDWAADEGWNPGLDDAPAFHAADPQGFFVAEVSGRPVASVSVVNHDPMFAFLGFYICDPAFRGQGIGLQLWNHALKHAGTRTVGLDGVADQVANYARSGFQQTGATIRLEGTLPPQTDARIAPAAPADIETLVSMDAAANGFCRPGFLQTWLSATPNRQSLAVRDKGQLTGFATIRRCRTGLKIGPNVAQDAKTAICLARAGLAHFDARTAIIDVPGTNVELLTALRGLGFTETFATARMYRGTAPTPNAVLQAIGTMELG